MRKRAYLVGPRHDLEQGGASITWPSFENARRSPTSLSIRRLEVRTLEEESLELPAVSPRSSHAACPTPPASIQHAIYSLPDFHHGYCTDDNARALILTVLLEDLELEAPRTAPAERNLRQLSAVRLQSRPRNASAISWASTAAGWSRVGSEDSQGRALWALGTCVGPLQAPRPPGLGRRNCSSARFPPFSTPHRRAPGPTRSSASTNISAASTATASPRRSAIP